MPGSVTQLLTPKSDKSMRLKYEPASETCGRYLVAMAKDVRASTLVYTDRNVFLFEVLY